MLLMLVQNGNLMKQEVGIVVVIHFLMFQRKTYYINFNLDFRMDFTKHYKHNCVCKSNYR